MKKDKKSSKIKRKGVIVIKNRIDGETSYAKKNKTTWTN